MSVSRTSLGESASQLAVRLAYPGLSGFSIRLAAKSYFRISTYPCHFTRYDCDLRIISLALKSVLSCDSNLVYRF